jgi:hypothetical protein
MNRYLPLCSLILAVTAMPALAGNVTLSFTSLPSAQGFDYQTSGQLTEAQAFSLSGNLLEQNSIGPGWNSLAFYVDAGVVSESPFALNWTAELIEEEDSMANNFAGFAVSVTTPTQYYLLGLGAGGIDLRNGYDEDIISTATLSASGVSVFSFHDYTLLGNPGAAEWSFFIDGTQWATGSSMPVSEPSRLAFGDLTAGPNAIGDTSAFSFDQPPGVPEPSTFWLVGGIIAALLMRRSHKEINSR